LRKSHHRTNIFQIKQETKYLVFFGLLILVYSLVTAHRDTLLGPACKM